MFLIARQHDTPRGGADISLQERDFAMQPINILFVLLAILTAGVLAYIAYRLIAYRQGVLGHRRVTSAMKKYGLIRGYRVLENVTFEAGGRQADVELMMIGFFGILFVYSLNDTAEYYGDAKGEHWVQVNKKSRKTIDNFMARRTEAIDVVREIFSKNKVYNIRMEGVTVFCGNPKKSLIGLTNAQGILNFSEYKTYLNKAKFEKDNDVDVPALYDLLMKYKVAR